MPMRIRQSIRLPERCATCWVIPPIFLLSPIFRGRRAGSDQVQESTWTIERARQLGLAGKPNWKNQPEAMLMARATAECSRLVASDALLGIPFSAEELADGVYGELPAAPSQEPAAPAAPPRRTAQRRTQPRAVPPQPETITEPAEDPQGPPLPGEDDYDEPPPQAADDPATRPQLTKLHTIFSKGGITNRETRLQACNLIIGRVLTTSDDLTKAEAHKLIEVLENEPQSTLAEFVAELIGTTEPGTSGDES